MKAEHSFEKEMPDGVLYDWLDDKKTSTGNAHLHESWIQESCSCIQNIC